MTWSRGTLDSFSLNLDFWPYPGEQSNRKIIAKSEIRRRRLTLPFIGNTSRRGPDVRSTFTSHLETHRFFASVALRLSCAGVSGSSPKPGCRSPDVKGEEPSNDKSPHRCFSAANRCLWFEAKSQLACELTRALQVPTRGTSQTTETPMERFAFAGRSLAGRPPKNRREVPRSNETGPIRATAFPQHQPEVPEFHQCRGVPGERSSLT
jgi:hypothetical protein